MVPFADRSRPRPGTAVALGSGSARGLAHIGILRVLREAGVPVKAVAGTSIGSVIGGLWCGAALDTYESLMRGLDRQGVIWFLDPVLPVSGFFGGKRTSHILETLLGDRRIENLPVGFCAIATDLATGHEVRLRSGGLVAAIKASSSIPGVFQPQRIGDRWLTDGGAVAPVPVAAAREFGYRHVIAVDLHAASFPEPTPAEAAEAAGAETEAPPPAPAEPPQDPEAVERARQLLEQTAGLMDRAGRRLAGRAVQFWQRLTHRPPDKAPGFADIVGDTMAFAQLALARLAMQLDPPDLLLTPRLPGVGLFDFHRAAEIIAEGERCAREALDQGLLDPMIQDGRSRRSRFRSRA
ncbi:MAG: hypothetical protein D6702_00990 [Planctomycetota bacterium]|nr:MAG: hypothetical protein D6702_00990 [Planctomycetota bacterium]